MKIYCVTRPWGPFEGDILVGVFSSVEKAREGVKEFLATHDWESEDNIDITEFELDKLDS